MGWESLISWIRRWEGLIMVALYGAYVALNAVNPAIVAALDKKVMARKAAARPSLTARRPRTCRTLPWWGHLACCSTCSVCCHLIAAYSGIAAYSVAVDPCD